MTTSIYNSSSSCFSLIRRAKLGTSCWLLDHLEHRSHPRNSQHWEDAQTSMTVKNIDKKINYNNKENNNRLIRKQKWMNQMRGISGSGSSSREARRRKARSTSPVKDRSKTSSSKLTSSSSSSKRSTSPSATLLDVDDDVTSLFHDYPS